MKQKVPMCRTDGCGEVAYLGGLCQSHHEEKRREEASRDRARKLLFGEDSGISVEDRTLQEDLRQLRDRWNHICGVAASRRSNDLVPLEEVVAASDCCITFAARIIEAQLAIVESEALPHSYERDKRSAWDQLHAIERTPKPAESATTKP
jgi:hypothetical protein